MGVPIRRGVAFRNYIIAIPKHSPLIVINLLFISNSQAFAESQLNTSDSSSPLAKKICIQNNLKPMLSYIQITKQIAVILISKMKLSPLIKLALRKYSLE